MSMKLSEILYDNVKDLWNQAAAKPFVIEMAKGILSREHYRYYMIQDYLYLLEYTDILAAIQESCNDPELRSFIGDVIEQVKEETMQVHVPNMREMGITEEEISGCPESPEIADYVNYMRSLVKEEGILAGLTAQLQCSWVYAYIGLRMKEQYPEEISASPYKGWFDAYTCDAYTGANQKWIDTLDKMADDIEAEDAEKLCRIFKTCAEYENRFWDMLYKH